MTAIARTFLLSLVRKVVFALGAGWLVRLIEQGVLSNADVERFIEIAVAALLILVPALWTFVKTWWQKRQANSAAVYR